MAVKAKTYQRKKRNSYARKRKPIVFLSAEGNNKTETGYFIDFAKDKNRVIRFAYGDYTDPVNMVNMLKKEMQDEGFDAGLGDTAFCLIDSDMEQNKNDQISRADQIASQASITVLVSSPCFEIWFICHFLCSTKWYPSNEHVLTEIKRYIADYSKNLPGMYSRTSEYISTAIANSKKINEACVEAGYSRHTTAFSPSTEVHYLAEELSKSNE